LPLLFQLRLPLLFLLHPLLQRLLLLLLRLLRPLLRLLLGLLLMRRHQLQVQPRQG
jgi:hypothetical protein